MANIAFIGLGNMGGGMAARQVAGGREVAAFDLSEAAIAKVVGAGATGAKSVAEAVKGADAVITMLPAGKHVLSVYTGEKGILTAARPGTLFIDSSTIDVKTAREVIAAAEAKGMLMVDAPVSGGVAGAENAALTFMVGGTDAAFGKAKPLLEAMGKKIVHAGGAGNGQVAKICNNMVLGISMIGVCEAIALAERLGLDPERFFDIASKSSGQCWSITNYYPWPGPVEAAPSNRGYAGGFATAMMLKDLKLAQQAAASAGAAAPLGAQAEGMYALFDRLGYGGKDFSAILQMLRGRLDDLA